MDTKHRSGIRASVGIRLLGMVGLGIVLLASQALQAQSAGRLGSSESKTKQEADRLVAMTRPSYYKALLVPDWRIKHGDHTPANTAAALLCSRSKTQSIISPILQLNGERLDEKQVQLTCETSDDGTTYTLAIERSLKPADGFETVSFLQTTHAASQVVTQQIVDLNAYADYLYYRLKRVELTGATTFSQTIAVKGELRPLTVKAFPNPGQQRSIKFEVAGPTGPESVSFALYNVEGRILYQYNQAALETGRRFGLPTGLALQAGTYYLKISVNDQHTSTSFILQP